MGTDITFPPPTIAQLKAYYYARNYHQLLPNYCARSHLNCPDPEPTSIVQPVRLTVGDLVTVALETEPTEPPL